MTARAFAVLLCVFCGVSLSLLLSAGPAAAQMTATPPANDKNEKEADTLYELAEKEDAAFHFADAIRLYDAAVARLPSHPRAIRAETRSAVLRAHAEGHFAPYVRLEQVRRDPALSNDATAIEGLANDAASWPDGPSRAEARVLVAEAFAGRLDRPRDAIPLLNAVTSDPAADALTVRQARQMEVDTLLALGDFPSALTATTGEDREGRLRQRVLRLLRRHRLHEVSIGTVFTFFALALFAVARVVVQRGHWGTRDDARDTKRRLGEFARLAGFYAVWTGCVGGVLASVYQAGNATPFVALGGMGLLIATLARAWALVGSAGVPARTARAVVAASTVVAAAFLVLERFDSDYLDGFGL